MCTNAQLQQLTTFEQQATNLYTVSVYLKIIIYVLDCTVRTIYVHKSQLTSKIKNTNLTMLQLNDSNQEHGVTQHSIGATINPHLLVHDT